MTAVIERGVPGVNGAAAPASFEEFWRFYLSQHLHPATRRAHVAGMTAGWIAVGVGLALSQAWMVVGLPILGYLGAIPSHYIWEKNRPASFLGPRAFVWSIACDLRMTWRFYTQHLDSDVDDVRAALPTTGPAGAGC